MHLNGKARTTICLCIALFAVSSWCAYGQAALLMEEPYGLYGTLNPTGHNALYLENVCAETPVKLRHCHPGELGAVISRYEGVDGYDWVAIPLIPYLYAVERADEVPTHVTHDQVVELRNRYREQFLHPLGLDKPGSRFVLDGWTQLIGAAYERRIYAFRFNTTPAQDDALIASLNDRPNRSHFHMLFRNCADFARQVLNIYFPHTFHRSIFPDAGITTPKQIAHKLVHYAHKHPGLDLTVVEIPQIPGYSWHSHSTKDIAEAFSTTAYAIPLTLLNPYIAGGIFIDYIVRGRYHLLPKHPAVVEPDDLEALTQGASAGENSAQSTPQADGAADLHSGQIVRGINFDLRESKAPHGQERLTESQKP